MSNAEGGPPALKDAATSMFPLSSATATPAAVVKPAMDAGSYLALFFGPVRQYLDDDDVSEVLINGPRQIYIERKGKLTATEARFTNEQALQAAVKNVARNVGRFFNEENPRLDARLPDGSRVHAVIPPLSRQGTVVAIRKFRKDKLKVADLVRFGSISETGVRLIDALVKLHKNIIVSGATSSGKTSVLNVLSSFIPANERILVIEDSSELQLQQVHTVCFETRKADEHGKGEVSIRDLVHSSLRLRPDRLVIGEIRGGEALDLLQALNTGHAGSMSTIHANGPVDCLSRIETCALLSGIDIPLSALRSQVASAINVVVHTARLGDGSRKITHVSEVLGLEKGEYVVQDLLIFKQEAMDENGVLLGHHTGTGAKPTFLDEARIRRIELEESWFRAG
jgi:pilus assembly protein CpaF